MYFNHRISEYAVRLGIQKDFRHYVDGQRTLKLFTCMALREVGERHVDANGGDPSLSAQAAGHTMRTKIKHYQGEQDWESVHESYREHHPAFVEGW